MCFLHLEPLSSPATTPLLQAITERQTGPPAEASASRWLSPSHTVVRVCQRYRLSAPRPLLPSLGPQSVLCLHPFPVNRFISTVLHRFLLTSFWPRKPNCSVFSCLSHLGAAVCSVSTSLIWIQEELVIFQPVQLAICC